MDHSLISPSTTTTPSSYATLDLCLVPANSMYKSSILSAVRAMADSATSGVFLDTIVPPQDSNHIDTADVGGGSGSGSAPGSSASDPAYDGVPLGLALEAVLEFMEQARHPGHGGPDYDDGVYADCDGDAAAGGPHGKQRTELRYAGGRILCLLGNPPLEIAPPTDDSMSHIGQPEFYQGGMDGACFKQDNEDRWSVSAERKAAAAAALKNQDYDTTNKKKKKKNDKKTKTQMKDPSDLDPTDMTAQNLKDFVIPLDPEDQLAAIGRRCASAALGVDLFILVPENNRYDESKEEKSNAASPMSSSQGGRRQQQQLLRTFAPPAHIRWYGVPLLRVLSDTSGAPGPLMFGTTATSFDTALEHVIARTPWQLGMVFGGELRLRISPGFEVEDTPVETSKKSKLQLGLYLSSGGLMGPAVEHGGSDPDSSALWIMGSCDPYTSFSIDLQVAKEVQDRFHAQGLGEVVLKPVIQTCMMYTSIETDGTEANNYYTVRKMRVASLPLTLTDEVEPILDALDPEALAVVLYHKIAMDAYMDGLVSAQKTAEAWLQSFMICVYMSAQLEQAKLEEMVKKYHTPSKMESTFIGRDRLLDQEGDMEVEDVLLGQGHPKTAVIPLLVYSLMQCDALRPSGGNFQPSMDARACAMTQMASMKPSVLAKSIAPSMVLWSVKDDEAIMESLPLSKIGILNCLEGSTNSVDDGNTMILVDTPREVMLYRTERLSSSNVTKGNTRVIKVGPRLESTLYACADGLRTTPSRWVDVESFLNGGEFTETSSRVFNSMLLEDKPTASGIQDFEAWKVEIALEVQAELEKSGDI
jgi:hypothetical protein